MKKWIIILSVFSLAFTYTLAFAEKNTLATASGRLFSLAWTGNNLQINTTKPAWFYQFAGIKSQTSGFSFSSCTPSDNGYCLFSASDTLTAAPILAGPAIKPSFTLCLNGVGNTYSCEKATMGDRFAYVANNNNSTISLCPINSINGNFVNCVGLAPAGLAFPRGMALNPTGTFFYVAKGNGDVSLCPINVNETLGACSNLNAYGTYDNPQFITLNNAGTIAYITNAFGIATPAGVSVCSINSANGSFDSCTAYTGNGTFVSPTGITLNSSNTMVYVANLGNSTVSICPLNANGSLGTCTTSNGDLTINNPQGIALNSTNTLAYIANSGNNTVSICPINTDGSFATCTASNGNGTFNSSKQLTLNSANTLAYVTNFNNTVSICSINTNGSLGTCTTSNGDLTINNPFGIALF